MPLASPRHLQSLPQHRLSPPTWCLALINILPSLTHFTRPRPSLASCAETLLPAEPSLRLGSVSGVLCQGWGGGGSPEAALLLPLHLPLSPGPAGDP